MAQNNWEADKMLDVYIYDYFVKRKLHASAKTFQDEGKVSSDPVAIDAPGGFLFEWWSVFWDIFIARTNEKHSETAASYIETQLIKARELQQQHQKPQQQQQQQQLQQQIQKPHLPQMQMQQLLLQRQAHQQQRREGVQLPNGSTNGISGNDTLAMQNPGTANVLAPKMYEDRLKPPVQRDPMDDTDVKQKFGENMGHLLDPNHASSLGSTSGGQPPGQPVHGAPGGISRNVQQVQNRTQQLPLSTQDVKNEINPIMDPRAAGPEGSFIGVQGSNHGGSLTLKGWPLTGLDQLRSGIFQQQKSLMQPSQPLHQFQLQQQLLLQAQQNSTSPSANDMESRRLRMLLNNRNMGLDVVSSVGSPVPVGCSAVPRGDADMLMKLQQQQQQNNNQQLQQYSQHPLSTQQSQNTNLHLQQQDKNGGSVSITGDPNMSSTFGGNDQASKTQLGRKRKQPASSSGPANSSGTANTAGPSASSAPSTPSTHTPGDVISMATLPYTGTSSKPLLMFGSDGMPPNLASASNQLADIDRFVDDGSLDDNVESFLANDDVDPRDTVAPRVDVSKGFAFSEVAHFCASTSKIECCHFSSDGKLLATGGHDKKAVLWCTDSQSKRSTLEEHTFGITDVRFSPSMPRLGTSSHDRTVRVWDADNPGYSLRTFMGHSSSVMSLDFHPNKEDLICSCDGNGEIRYWSINNGSCTEVSKGAMISVRFQPRLGKFFAAAAENTISIFDVETRTCRHSSQGHRNVQSLCWDPSGDYMASVSDDLVRVWTIGSGGEAECIHELSGIGKKFKCCVFHPSYSSTLLIGCYQALELWDMAATEKKTTILSAHDSQIAGLAASSATGLVASVGHDKTVKLWK